MINLHFVGQLNDQVKLAAVGMGTMTGNVIGLSFILGFNQVLDCLVSKEAGAGNIELCGVLYNRGQLFVLFLMIPITIILQYSEQILVLCGQNQQVAIQAQVFITSFLPSLFFQGIGDCLVRLLNNLGKTEIPFISSAIGIVVHYFISWYFVITCNY